MTHLEQTEYEPPPLYWYQGKRYNVPPFLPHATRRLVLGNVAFTTTFATARSVRELNLTAFPPSTSRCDGWQHTGLQQTDLWQSGTTAEKQVEALGLLSVRQGRATAPLRNPALEQYIAEDLAKARRDSLSKARAAAIAAREDSEAVAREATIAKTRQDSLARARTTAGRSSVANRTGTDATRGTAGTSGAAGATSTVQAQARTKEELDRVAARARVAAEAAARAAAHTVERWSVAEAAFARGDHSTAQPIYAELRNDPTYGPQARQRLEAINAQAYDEAALAAAKAVVAVTDALDGVAEDFSRDLDDFGVPRFAGGFVGVNGASNWSVGMGTYRFFVLEAHVSQMVLPAIPYTVYNDNRNRDDGAIALQSSGWSMGLATGVSFPYRKIVPYVTFGADWVLANMDTDPTHVPSSAELDTPSYTIAEQSGTTTVWRTTLGLQYRLSDNFGIGLSYMTGSFSAPDLDGASVNGGRWRNEEYIVTEPVNSSSKWNTFRLQMFFALNNPRPE